MSKSNYLEAALLNHTYGGTTFTPPATVYIALSTADPGEAGAGLAEPSGGAYARLAVTNNTTNWPAATGTSPTTKANGTIFQFPTPTAGWGLITHFAIYDASSGGNLLNKGALTVAKTINTDDDVEFPVGTLTITED
jgi:hypothetical protein